MDAPRAPRVPGYDQAAASAVVSAALAQRGGAALVVTALSRVPGATATPARSGLFRSSPALVQLGEWRYEARADRITAAHVVRGIALATAVLAPVKAGPHVAAALGLLLADEGAGSLPEVLALLEGLSVASG